VKRLISLLVSAAVLTLIYAAIDVSNLVSVFAKSDLFLLTTSLLMVVPLTYLTAWRLVQLMPHSGTLRIGEASRLTLAASVLNVVLPSKMGDLAKAHVMKDRCKMTGSLAFALVVFEKTLDMLALLVWCVFGLTFIDDKNAFYWFAWSLIACGLITGILIIGSRRFALKVFAIGKRIAPIRIASKLDKLQEAWGEMHAYVWQNKNRLFVASFTSVFLWFLHLLQIWLFILALKAWTPFIDNLALAPLSILAGLVPLTFAGVGTRDAAIIIFYQPYLLPATAAAVGVLCTMRYIMPALAGLPFFYFYLKLLGNSAKT
jgi:uncharacterized protein (TIRG00374 family)